MLSHVVHRNCIFDMCVEDDADTLCRHLKEYVLACQEQGVNMEGWRQQTACGKYRKKLKVWFLPKGLSKYGIRGFC